MSEKIPNEKIPYEKPKIQIVTFNPTDIIAASDPYGIPEDSGDNNGEWSKGLRIC